MSLVQFSHRQCVTNMQFGDRTNASLAHNLLVVFRIHVFFCIFTYMTVLFFFLNGRYIGTFLLN